MKKILILTSRFPYPVIGGDRLRIYKQCEVLSKRYDLTLLSLCESRNEMNMLINDNVFKEIHRIYLPQALSYVNTLLSLPTNTPLQIAYYKSKHFKRKLQMLAPSHDLIFSHLIRTGDYIKNEKCLRVLEMTDAISMNYKRVSQNGKTSLRKLIFSFEQKRLEQYEKKIADNFHMVSFISEVDRNYLYPHSRDNISIYSNGVDMDHFPFLSREINKGEKIELVFIGNMYSLQNIDAVKWFSTELLPLLNKSSDSFVFKIIGKIKNADASFLASLPNVIVTGAVDNISQIASTGHIGICPMRLGAGIQNKILEYMSLGLPCVTSSVGFEGLGAIDKTNILLAKEVEDYVNIINHLVNDSLFYEKIASNARAFVENNYSWEAKLEPMLNDIDKLLGK